MAEKRKIKNVEHYVYEGIDEFRETYPNTIVHPDCPNFFDMMDDSYVGVHNYGSYDWIIRSIEIYQK